MEIGTTAAGCRVGFFGGSEGAACGGALGSNEMRAVRESREAGAYGAARWRVAAVESESDARFIARNGAALNENFRNKSRKLHASTAWVLILIVRAPSPDFGCSIGQDLIAIYFQ